MAIYGRPIQDCTFNSFGIAHGKLRDDLAAKRVAQHDGLPNPLRVHPLVKEVGQFRQLQHLAWFFAFSKAWFFGHPEVYIMFLPGLGIVASIIPTFARRPIIGYVPLVLSFIVIGFVGFGVWVHHMFATGLTPLGMSLFSVASFAISVPSGVQIFAALATFWYGRLWIRVPLLYVFGFTFIFVLGGIMGVMVASIPFDWQVHDTYFLVAHFHYVLVGGVVFPLLGGLHYWFPKMSGRMLDERMGVWAFWLIFAGVNAVFFFMHLTGFYGMPRRVYTYLAGLGWEDLNLISTIGAFIIALGVLLYLFNVIKSLAGGEPASDNPWGAGTLEWATTSPPDPVNFRVTPAVRHLYPMWSEGAVSSMDQETLAIQEHYGLLPDRRETLGTSILDAVPQQRVVLPAQSIVPLVAALAVGVAFIGLAFDVLLVPRCLEHWSAAISTCVPA
jgi:cytochrome c oxidase subunit I+III